MRASRSVLLALCGGALAWLAAPLVAAAAPPLVAADKTLAIYFIDVEGGQSTLIVTPEHHGLLIDAGFAGGGTGFALEDPHRARDANRILAALRDAGLTRIDELLITHFHEDHDGGVTELAALVPIDVFIDHGAPTPEAEKWADTRQAFEAYARVRARARHLEPRVGDRLPLPDVEATVVSTVGQTLSPPAASGNAGVDCQAPALTPVDPYENPRSTGVLVSFGRFRFLDLGDLTGAPLHRLACPRNVIGPVDVYLVAHHGGPDAADPATFSAFAPRVAVMNNGPDKGGAPQTYAFLHHVAGLQDVWQLHASARAQNFPDRFIANPNRSTAYWIKLTARADGSFTIENARTREAKIYAARP